MGNRPPALSADLRALGRSGGVGKFNTGQKCFAMFIGGALPSMLLTGSVMHWFEPFPLQWRSGATFVHDWLGFALVAAVGGHIVKAALQPVLLRAMIAGWVPGAWGHRRRPRWAALVPDAADAAVRRHPRRSTRLADGFLSVALAAVAGR